MKHAELVQLLDSPDKHFSGYLVLKSQPVTWTLIYIQGQLLYIDDDLHAVRRWHRHLKHYFPNNDWLADVALPPDHQPWQIHLLDACIGQQRLSLIRAKLMVRAIIQECLFELSNCNQPEHYWRKSIPLPISRVGRSIALSGWESAMTFSKVKRMTEDWHQAGLSQLTPTLSPTLTMKVTPSTSPASLPIDHQYLRGDYTLWEIAGQLERSLVELAQSLMPLARDGRLEYRAIPDLPLSSVSHLTSPLSSPPHRSPPHQRLSPGQLQPTRPTPTPTISPCPAPPAPTGPVIACIDDSPVLSHGLKKILTTAGYRTLMIQEPMRGFSKLIEHKPSLILLDLMLPNADGYSVCKFLRDTPVFKETPIIILTAQNKPIDRARARLAGATEFLVKPPQPDHLLTMIHEHLAVGSCRS